MKPDWRKQPRRVQHTPPGALFSCLNRIPETAKAVLADKGQLGAFYATRTIEQTAKDLGCSNDAVCRALRFHGIPVRRAGAPLDWQPPKSVASPSRNGSYRSEIRRAAWRAYRRLDRCPPDCPWWKGCVAMSEETECRLEEEIHD